MKSFLVLALFGLMLTGCWSHHEFAEIVQKPSIEWSDDDCRTVLIEAMVHNLYKHEEPIKVSAIPFSPLVVTALNRYSQFKKKWSEHEYAFNVSQQLVDDLGLYFDQRSGQYMDGRGNFYRTPLQLDSLMFLLTLVNTTWPCISPVLIGVAGSPGSEKGIMKNLYGNNISDYPCVVPDIANLEQNIILENQKGESLAPRFVWGKKRNELTASETIFVMFPLRESGSHFLAGSDTVQLVINGLKKDVRFPFLVSRFGAFTSIASH